MSGLFPQTGKLVNSKERRRYDSIWVSTAANGKTIFKTHNADYVSATGAKEYK